MKMLIYALTMTLIAKVRYNLKIFINEDTNSNQQSLPLPGKTDHHYKLLSQIAPENRLYQGAHKYLQSGI